ncbi:MAG TPA: class I SAM-dependent methyltransferase [Candidatus Acidoferrum sp.]|jgi:SAM-dependent methyltransferase|nr:class I SAM-dependent methyltransferase [Candidatus Acidoferrum sp.]
MAPDGELIVSLPSPSLEDPLRRESMKWLSRFIDPLQATGGRVLDLGCGLRYADAEVLADMGLTVFACDLSLTAAPDNRNVHPFVADISQPLPIGSAAVDVVLASLSLHYFPWITTTAVVEEFRRVLRPNGLLLVRVNATDDIEHGAGVGEEVEPNYFDSGGKFGASRKRFFDEAAVLALLGGGFTVQHLRHATTYRFGAAKQVWECLALSEPCSGD